MRYNTTPFSLGCFNHELGLERGVLGYLQTKDFLKAPTGSATVLSGRNSKKFAIKTAFSRNVFNFKIYEMIFDFKKLISPKKDLQLSTIGCINRSPTEFILFRPWFLPPNTLVQGHDQLIDRLSQNPVHNRLSQENASGIFSVWCNLARSIKNNSAI